MYIPSIVLNYRFGDIEDVIEVCLVHIKYEYIMLYTY